MSSKPKRPPDTLADKLVKFSPWIGLAFGVVVAGGIAIGNALQQGPATPNDSPPKPGRGDATLGQTLDTAPLLSNSRRQPPQAGPARPDPSLAAQIPAVNTVSQSTQPNVSGPIQQTGSVHASASQPAARPATADVPSPNAGSPARRPPAWRGRVETINGTVLHGDILVNQNTLTLQLDNGIAQTISLDELKFLQPLPAAPPVAPRHGVRATYFSNRNLAGSQVTRLEPVIDFDWQQGAPMGVPPEDFSSRWEGELETPVSGRHTFATESNDGVRLWVNGKLVIDQWNHHGNTLHEGAVELQAGKRYALKMEHYEQGGTATARLFWSPPGRPRAIVPTEHLYPPAGGEETTGETAPFQDTPNGLIGHYFNAQDLKGKAVTRLDPVIDFNWRSEAPMKDLGRENFSVRWTGQIEVPVTGEYTFYTQSDDGARLWINQQKLIEAWRHQSVSESKGTITLQSGRRYPLRLEYFEGTGEAVVRLLWQGPNLSPTIIPARYLSPGDAVPDLRASDPQPPGVLLAGGSFIVGRVESADDTRVQLTGSPEATTLSTVKVAQLRLQALSLEQEKQLPANRTGLWLTTREFMEGRFATLVQNRITLQSVLHGKRTFERHQVLAICLRELNPAPARFEVWTRSDSRLLTDTFVLTPDGIQVRDSTLIPFVVPVSEVMAIRKRP